MTQIVKENGYPDQTASLIAELGNSDGSSRRRARIHLIAEGASAVPALKNALSDCNEHIRWEAAKVLGKIHDPSTAPDLVVLLEDKDVDVRWAAAESLVRLGKSAVVPILSMLVKELDSVWLREGARYVLHHLKRKGSLGQPARKVLKALDGLAPEIEVPWAANTALEAMHVNLENVVPISSPTAQEEIDISMGAEVKCLDGVFGKIICVIINPIAEKITHLVVEGQNFPKNEVLVPVEQVADSSSTKVQLKCKLEEMKNLKPFVETEFLPNSIYNINSAPSMLWPYDAPGLGVIVLEHERIPQNELAIHRGSHVIAKDGETGQVDEFLIDPENGSITHLILREGHIWNREEVIIPVSQIGRIEEDKVFLKLEKCAIEELPSIPLRRKRPVR